ncbi:TetR/AcrR family transcriptional regulator [Streptomyces sp. NPDC051985]|uniref:TetR/AcrR family transcriptional regulator n=1 Tax=Streptomyces sp. NPDC051985 TaxID=3155807 RepID=UPI003422B57D
MPDTAPARPGRGRRADPDIDPRVLDTTVEVYGEVGWAGFTMDLVARRAGVGKAALYRRWPTKEKLLVAALDSSLPHGPEAFDTGSLRGDLLALADMILARYLSPSGIVHARAMIEAKLYPDIFGKALEEMGRRAARMGREMVFRAVDRGELPLGASPALILDSLAGTIIHHVLLTPADRLPDLQANSASYAERVVDFVLSAATHRSDDSPLPSQEPDTTPPGS